MVYLKIELYSSMRWGAWAVLQASLLLVGNLNETRAPIFCSVVCSLFPEAVFLTFIHVDNEN